MYMYVYYYMMYGTWHVAINFTFYKFIYILHDQGNFGVKQSREGSEAMARDVVEGVHSDRGHDIAMGLSGAV